MGRCCYDERVKIIPVHHGFPPLCSLASQAGRKRDSMIPLDCAHDDECCFAEVRKHRPTAASLEACAYNADSHRESTSTVGRPASNALVDKSCLGHLGRLEHIGSVENHRGPHDVLEPGKVEVSELGPRSDQHYGVGVFGYCIGILT